MPLVPLTRDGPVAAPLDYVVPQQGELLPVLVRAVLDGTSAASAFYAVVEIIAPSGRIMGIGRSDAIAAGASADVSWFPLKRGGAVTVTPSPNPLGTLWAWYDFSDTSTITLDGSGKIATIRDKTGNGHNLSQSTLTARPGETTINALNAGLFNSAASTNLLGSGSAFTPGLASPYTVLVVNTLTAAASGNYYPGAVGGTTLGTQVLIQTDPFSRPFLQLNASSIVSGGQPQPHTQYLFTAIVDGASSAIRVNGVSTTGTLDVSTLSSIAIGQAHVPEQGGPAISALDGAVGEVLYYTTHLSATQLSAVESYLKTKWATP